ncbi:MAG TPA: PIN domain-containing protein [Desulfobacteraceae bacterium]|nr:PIN domain-containing protein [Desulfobacteraceae bacterium]HPJ66395.1 PIN domain-containing protein [Desulfobacteraceae bacterium]HPQ27317.1 PIN domain-containing protein [Desulfobacteraceae bacterium]
MNTLFVDTGAWFALADTSDKYHDHAINIFPDLLRNNRLLTTNHVIAETYILIRRNLGHEAAITFLNNIAASPRVSKIYSDSLLEKSAEDILRQYKDQDFSYTDAVSFAVMNQQGITQAFSFDHHFLTAGFTLIP